MALVSFADAILNRPSDKMSRGPDIIATVRFFLPEEGGRRVPTPADLFKCPLEFEGEKFDCGLHLERSGPVKPGETDTVEEILPG